MGERCKLHQRFAVNWATVKWATENWATGKLGNHFGGVGKVGNGETGQQ